MCAGVEGKRLVLQKTRKELIAPKREGGGMKEERSGEGKPKSITWRTPGTHWGDWSRKHPQGIKWLKDILRAMKSTIALEVVCIFII